VNAQEIETPADRLREAAERIRDHYGRGRVIDRMGRVCAIGALCQVEKGSRPLGTRIRLHRDPMATAALLALNDYLVEQGARQPSGIGSHPADVVAYWNDHALDGSVVASMMQKAAARLEERV
jgi:hypothetical protein